VKIMDSRNFFEVLVLLLPDEERARAQRRRGENDR
jgi:hypothetical protein